MKHFKRSMIYYTLLLSTLAAILVSIQLFDSNGQLSRDSYLYINFIDTWEAHKNYEGCIQQIPNIYWIPPGAIWIMKLGKSLGYSTIFTGILINTIAIILAAEFLALSISELTKKNWIGYWGGLLALLHPAWIECAITVQREALYLLFMSIFFYGTIKCCLTSYRWAWLAGWGAGCAMFTRYEGYELTILFCLIQSLHFFYSNNNFRSTYKPFVFFFCSIFTSLFLWTTISNTWEYWINLISSKHILLYFN